MKQPASKQQGSTDCHRHTMSFLFFLASVCFLLHFTILLTGGFYLISFTVSFHLNLQFKWFCRVCPGQFGLGWISICEHMCACIGRDGRRFSVPEFGQYHRSHHADITCFILVFCKVAWMWKQRLIPDWQYCGTLQLVHRAQTEISVYKMSVSTKLINPNMSFYYIFLVMTFKSL